MSSAIWRPFCLSRNVLKDTNMILAMVPAPFPLPGFLYRCSLILGKSMQLIWRSGTQGFHLSVPDLQMSDLPTQQGTGY